MTVKVSENEELIRRRNELWVLLESPSTSAERKRTIAAEILSFDEAITRNLEQRLQHLRTSADQATNETTPMTKKQRLIALKRVGREGQELVNEVREFKKLVKGK